MESCEYYNLLAEDLVAAKLSKRQVKKALAYRVEDKETLSAIDRIVDQKFAQWLPSGMISVPDEGYDFDANSSYQSRGQRLVQEEDVAEEVDEEEDAATKHKKQELVRLISETAEIADSKGLTRQADFLDHILTSLGGSK